jgi:hypothetical protein
MARKMNAFKMSPEAHGQPMPPGNELYLAHLRRHVLNLPPPGARLQIAVQIEEQSQTPREVKIIHTDSN